MIKQTIQTTKNLFAQWFGEEWEAHFDYCAVFHDMEFKLISSGLPCSEDCANRPGSKRLLSKTTKRVREV